MTRQEIINRLLAIKNAGLVMNARYGNDGGVGNTLEDLLDIPENNIPTTDAGEYEIKAKRYGDKSMTTLFHFEPSPKKSVPNLLLPVYGWKHKTIDEEMSFRCTMSGNKYMNRGFKVKLDHNKGKLVVNFNQNITDKCHSDWLDSIIRMTGGGEIDPQPYWTFQSLEEKVSGKLRNAFFVVAKVINKKQSGLNIEYYLYDQIWVLEGFSFAKFLSGIDKGKILIDFDARTHHNHGTKFRFSNPDDWFEMYESVIKIS